MRFKTPIEFKVNYMTGMLRVRRMNCDFMRLAQRHRYLPVDDITPSSKRRIEALLNACSSYIEEDGSVVYRAQANLRTMAASVLWSKRLGYKSLQRSDGLYVLRTPLGEERCPSGDEIKCWTAAYIRGVLPAPFKYAEKQIQTSQLYRSSAVNGNDDLVVVVRLLDAPNEGWVEVISLWEGDHPNELMSSSLHIHSSCLTPVPWSVLDEKSMEYYRTHHAQARNNYPPYYSR